MITGGLPVHVKKTASSFTHGKTKVLTNRWSSIRKETMQRPRRFGLWMLHCPNSTGSSTISRIGISNSTPSLTTPDCRSQDRTLVQGMMQTSWKSATVGTSTIDSARALFPSTSFTVAACLNHIEPLFPTTSPLGTASIWAMSNITSATPSPMTLRALGAKANGISIWMHRAWVKSV